MWFISYCHNFHVVLLKIFWTQTFRAPIIYQLTLCDAALEYLVAGQAWASLSLVSAPDCPSRNWAKDTTDVAWQKKVAQLNTAMNTVP